MLLKLGLEVYEKSFKKGHFADLTLPLLTDRLSIHTSLSSLSLLCSNFKLNLVLSPFSSILNLGRATRIEHSTRGKASNT